MKARLKWTEYEKGGLRHWSADNIPVPRIREGVNPVTHEAEYHLLLPTGGWWTYGTLAGAKRSAKNWDWR